MVSVSYTDPLRGIRYKEPFQEDNDTAESFALIMAICWSLLVIVTAESFALIMALYWSLEVIVNE